MACLKIVAAVTGRRFEQRSMTSARLLTHTTGLFDNLARRTIRDPVTQAHVVAFPLKYETYTTHLHWSLIIVNLAASPPAKYSSDSV